MSIDSDGSRSLSGSEFRTVGPATEKARRPKVCGRPVGNRAWRGAISSRPVKQKPKVCVMVQLLSGCPSACSFMFYICWYWCTCSPILETSIWFWSWSRSSSQPADDWSYKPSGRLPLLSARAVITSQPQKITARWPLPKYTAWWPRHMCVNNLPRVALGSTVAGIETRDL